jgi:hypothetical protein
MLAVAPGLSEDWWKQVAPSRNEFGLLFAAAGLITVLALIWAIFIRKRENDRPSRYSYPHVAAAVRTDNPSTGDAGRQRRRKRKRRRNPTLAETGGLPPIRNGDFPDDPP